MTRVLRAVVPPFPKTSMPVLDAALPTPAAALPSRTIFVPSMVFVKSLMFAAVSLMIVAGCGEIQQDESAPSASPSTSPPPSPDAVYLTSETTASMNLPFSDAVRVGHLLFLSGQIGNIPGTTDLAPGGIQGEARQTMENIRTVLEANGSSMDRVIKATVMLADIAEWPAFNEVYVTYFPGDKPARSAFAGSGLAFGARCEVEVIATVGE